MSSPVRRSLVLAIALALLLGVAGAARAAIGSRRRRPRRPSRGIDVDATTIPQLQALMDRHRLTSVQLTQFYLHRIKKLNPKLQRRDHRQPDGPRRRARRRQGAPPGRRPAAPRHPDHRQGQHRTRRACRRPAGSWALAGSTPGDAFIVQRLRAAGAIVIGKANLSEWANFRSGPSSSGWSGIGGQTNMAYVLDRNPCGSSSGSGVAVVGRPRHRRRRHRDRRLDRLPVGRERHRRASSRPSGCVSRAGVVPISADQDTAGPMTRNVTDAAVAARRDDRHRPGRRRDGRPGRPRFHATTPSSSTPTRSTARGSASGASTTYDRRRSARGPTRSSDDTVDDARGARRDRRRPARTSIERRGYDAGVRGAAVRVQDRHRDATSRRTPAPATRRRSRT